MKVQALDYDTIDKGAVIPVERIEELTETKRGTEAYGLASLVMCETIEQELRARNKPVTLKIVKGCICVCIDPDASRVNKNRFASGLRRAARALAHHQDVDTGRLDKDEHRMHQRDGEIMSKMLQGAMCEGSQTILTAAYVRSVPGLPSSE